jgi:hypothetical protein
VLAGAVVSSTVSSMDNAQTGDNSVKLGSGDALQESESESESESRHRLRSRTLLIFGAALAFALLLVAASRYQPLTLTPGWASWGQPNSSDEVSVSLETTLTNTGPLGVDVTVLRPKVYADPPVVVVPLMPCFNNIGRSKGCGQDPRGRITGNRFRSFALAGGSSMPVAWQYSFSCRPHTGGWYTSGPVEVRVTYRFTLFTHTVLLVLDNTDTSGGSSCSSPQG